MKSYQEVFLICICIEQHEALYQLWVYMGMYISASIVIPYYQMCPANVSLLYLVILVFCF